LFYTSNQSVLPLTHPEGDERRDVDSLAAYLSGPQIPVQEPVLNKAHIPVQAAAAARLAKIDLVETQKTQKLGHTLR
jgi:hypothetical protein